MWEDVAREAPPGLDRFCRVQIGLEGCLSLKESAQGGESWKTKSGGRRCRHVEASIDRPALEFALCEVLSGMKG